MMKAFQVKTASFSDLLSASRSALTDINKARKQSKGAEKVVGNIFEDGSAKGKAIQVYQERGELEGVCFSSTF